MSKEIPQQTEWIQVEESKIGRGDPWYVFGLDLEIVLFKNKEGDAFTARIKQEGYVDYSVYGKVVGKVFANKGMVGEGPSPHGAYSGLFNLIEDDIVRWSRSLVIASAPPDKINEIESVIQRIMERTQSGNSGKVNIK